MTTIQYFNIAFDTWTAIICLVAAIIIFSNRSLEPKASWTMIGVLLTDCVINVFETLGYVFDRRQGDLSVTIQYVSHFLVYAGICILTMFVAMHFGRMIEVRGLRVAREVAVTIVISLINLAGVVASRFFGFYYSINDFIKLTNFTSKILPIFIFILS